MKHKNIEIIEYSNDYAKQVANMWQVSTSAWNGQEINLTEESVVATEGSGGYLKLYIAINNNKEVLGYCKVSNYSGEQNVAYIPILNVAPEYHGQGIGKALLQRATEYASSMKYNRIDLRTWPGNLKAVPLYKKMGYFWEYSENNCVHLLNFIPYIQNSELLKNLFSHIDFDKDFKRTIKVEADQESDGNFTIYTYTFINDSQEYSISFDKNSRLPYKVKTPNLTIELISNNNKPVFGEEQRLTVNTTL